MARATMKSEQVGGSCAKACRIVGELPETQVAAIADQPTEPALAVAVVHAKRSHIVHVSLADRAALLPLYLFDDHRHISFGHARLSSPAPKLLETEFVRVPLFPRSGRALPFALRFRLVTRLLARTFARFAVRTRTRFGPRANPKLGHRLTLLADGATLLAGRRRKPAQPASLRSRVAEPAAVWAPDLGTCHTTSIAGRCRRGNLAPQDSARSAPVCSASR